MLERLDELDVIVVWAMDRLTRDVELFARLAKRLTDAEAIERVERLRPIADRLGCTMAQLSLAWCTKNPNVSTVITGASKVDQVVSNFETLDVIPLLTDDVKAEMESALA